MKVFEIIAEKMIALLEEAIKNGGLAPWQKSWNARKVNYVTRRPYRGINLWILPEDECEFITFKQIKDLQVKNPDIKIKKGCKKHMVIFWQLNTYVDKKNKDSDLEDETRKKGLLTKFYTVFKLADIEGLESKFDHIDFQPIKACEDLIEKQTDLVIGHGGDGAFYSPKLHCIQLPQEKTFKSSEHYYSVLFHELIHWTGHETMLNRHTKTTRFGSEVYSKEELVAEMGASMLLGYCGISVLEIRDNQLAYLKGWLSKLSEDKGFILSAAQNAQKACDLLVSIPEELEEAI